MDVKKELINNSKISDSHKLRLMNEMDELTLEELEEKISVIQGEENSVKDVKKTKNVRYRKNEKKQSKHIFSWIIFIICAYLSITALLSIITNPSLDSVITFCMIFIWTFIACPKSVEWLENNNYVKNVKNWHRVLSFLAVFFIAIILIAINDSTSTQTNNYSSEITNTNYSRYSYNDVSVENKTSESEEIPIEELSERTKMLSSLSNLISTTNLVFDSGSYIAGEIPPGEYAFVRFGDGKYYCEKDSAKNIIENENFDSFGYVKVYGMGNLENKGVLINVSAFNQLGVTSAKEIYEKLNDLSDYNQGGYYKVGVDLPAGSYTLESTGRGYYAKMTGAVGDSDIIENDNFNGKVTINVSEGQYLKVSRATITPVQ